MRGLDGRLIADLNDNLPAITSGSILSPGTSSVNENFTEYVLLPVPINDPPYIQESIYDTSAPRIKPIQFNEPGLNNLFVDSQGVVKVLVGSSFRLKMKAGQPPIYNVENGKPTLIVDRLPLPPSPAPGVPVTLGSDESKIEYNWFKDDVEIVNDADLQMSGSTIIRNINGDELLFTNISPKFAGVYTCQASNDIGAIESEQITIEVYNPDIEDAFYNNLVQNPHGKDDVDQWQFSSTDFKVVKFTTAPFKDLSQPWNRDVFAYTPDMLYPRPYHINTYHIKNSNFTNDLLQEGSYFTRDRFKYKAKDGQAILNAEQDVDLADIVDYIQGSIYGVKGVRAVFGAYLGNAISRYKYTITTALTSLRNFRNTVDTTKPRPSKENCLLAGVPQVHEVVTVTIVEMDGETPLMSRVYDINTGNVSVKPGEELIDPWTKRIRSTPDIQLYTTGAYVSAGGSEEKLIHIAESVLPYPSQDYIATYAQFAEWNKVVIDRLNHRTNKIRITLSFTMTSSVLDYKQSILLDESDEVFETEDWETIARTGRFPQRDGDFYTAPNGTKISVYDINKLFYGNTIPVKQFFNLLGSSRGLVTGLNLVLMPIEQADPDKLDYYTKTLLAGDINSGSFTAVNTSVSPVTPLAQYLNSLNYENEYVGVHVSNVWRVPHRVLDVDPQLNLPFSDHLRNATTVEGADIASITAISTFKYVSGSTFGDPTSEIYNLSDDKKGNWAFAALDDLDQNLTGSVEVVYLSSPSQSIVQGTLPDIRGTIQSGILNFITDGLTTAVPYSYTTASIQDTEAYKRNLGFYFDFEIHKHGRGDFPPGTDTASLFRAWKEPDPAWQVNRIRHKHNLLQDITKDYVNLPLIPPPPPPPIPTSSAATGSASTGSQPPANSNAFYMLQWDPVIMQEALNQPNTSSPSSQANFLLNTTDRGYRLVCLSDMISAVNNNLTSSFARAKLLNLPRVAQGFTTASNDPWRLGANSILIGLEGFLQGNTFAGPVEYYYWVISRSGLNGYFRHGYDLATNTIPNSTPFTDPLTGVPEATILFPGSMNAAITGSDLWWQVVDAGLDTLAEGVEGWSAFVGSNSGPGLDQFEPTYLMSGYVDPVEGDIKAWPYTLDDLFEVTATDTTVNFILGGNIIHTIDRTAPGAFLRFSAKHCLVCDPWWQNPVGGITNVQYGSYNPTQPLSTQKGLPTPYQATDLGWLSVFREYEVNNYII